MSLPRRQRSGSAALAAARRLIEGSPGFGQPRDGRGTARKLWSALGSVLLIGALLAGLLVVHLHDRALHSKSQALQTLAVVLAAQAERSLEAVELLVGGLQEQTEQAGVVTAEAFRQAMAGEAVYRDLRIRAQSLRQLDAVAIIGASGDLINFSRSWPPPAANVADRDYFRAQRDDQTLTSFVSEPVQSRGSGAWTIYVSRRVSGPRGEFLGLILGAVELAYFEGFFASLIHDPDSSIGLLRTDGTLLARYPTPPRGPGSPILRFGYVREIGEAGVASGTLRQVSPVDGKERLGAVQSFARSPLTIMVTTTVDAALADWRKQAAYLIAAAIIVELGIVAVGLLSWRAFRSQGLLARANGAIMAANAAQAQAEADLALARQQEQADRELRLQHLRFGAALANMSQALCMFDAAGLLVVCNDHLGELFGLPPGVLHAGLGFNEIVMRIAAGAGFDAATLRLMRRGVRRLISRGESASPLWELPDGRALSVTFRSMGEEGWLMTIRDVTEQRRADARIAHMAHHDSLTGLPNRVLLHKRLGQALARGRRGEGAALFYLDLDHFKSVNDSLGHAMGDALLRAVTARLEARCPEPDTVARLGGDEFALILAAPSTADVGALVMDRAAGLIEALSAPYDIDGTPLVIGASIGIALIPQDGEDANDLLKKADIALYNAKAEGRGHCRRFLPAMEARLLARRLLEQDLRQALASDAFEVFYQPIMDLASGGLAGFEALLRWRHPERGLVSPADFIPAAEEMGLIVPLGRWVLRQACAEAAGWPAGTKLAVNLSPVQFASGTLVQDVVEALRDSGLSPDRLELEITETLLLEDTEATLAIMHELRDLGLSVAMDDFGTGYSSLGYLRRFPFDKVKIDRSFIAGLGQNAGSEAIVIAVLELCRTLGIRTTAEGVETAAQLAVLRRERCAEAQGYLFSPARPGSEVLALCAALAGASAEAPGAP